MALDFSTDTIFTPKKKKTNQSPFTQGGTPQKTGFEQPSTGFNQPVATQQTKPGLDSLMSAGAEPMRAEAGGGAEAGYSDTTKMQ